MTILIINHNAPCYADKQAKNTTATIRPSRLLMDTLYDTNDKNITPTTSIMIHENPNDLAIVVPTRNLTSLNQTELKQIVNSKTRTKIKLSNEVPTKKQETTFKSSAVSKRIKYRQKRIEDSIMTNKGVTSTKLLCHCKNVSRLTHIINAYVDQEKTPKIKYVITLYHSHVCIGPH
jgi:hypothetical protein